jgi:hypothetical protein
MMTDKIKSMLEKRPFRPFVIHTSDGDHVRVKAPDFAWIHPAGETMYVCPDPESSADQTINLSHVTRIVTHASSGNGKRKQR